MSRRGDHVTETVMRPGIRSFRSLALSFRAASEFNEEICEKLVAIVLGGLLQAALGS